MEDMDDPALSLAVRDSDYDEAYWQTRTPPGLVNLGHTCYLNSSLQVLRAMPQLHSALNG